MSETLSKEELAQFEQMRADDAAAGDEGLPPVEVAQPDPPAPVEPKAAEPDAPHEPKTVDKRALDEERSKRKKAEAAAAELQRKYDADLAKANARFEMLAEAAQAHTASQQPKAPEPAVEIPDFAADPQGYIKGNFEAMERRHQAMLAELKEAKAAAATVGETMQRQEATSQLESWAMQQEAAYAAETPDYTDAMKHLMAARAQQLRLIGVEDEARISQTIRQDVQGLANLARQQGRNFAEMLYGLAQANGFQKKAPGASATAPVTPKPSPAVDVDSAAERLIRGAEMATTLGAGGGAPAGEAAPAAIAAMSDAEFAKLYAKVQKNGGAAMRQLFGG